MTKLKDPLGQAFIEFCESQGIKFVDVDSGRPISEVTDEKTGKRLPARQQE